MYLEVKTSMTTNSNHQEAHGIGQIEDQLKQQANAGQGKNKTDQEIQQAANRDAHTSLDEIVDK